MEQNLTPAVFAYEGIQYQYMAPQVMEEKELNYLQEHLSISSYGVKMYKKVLKGMKKCVEIAYNDTKEK